MRWLKDGDTNSHLFHVVANGRRTKNFIAILKTRNEIIIDNARKEEVFFEAYHGLLGQIQNKEYGLDLESLGLPNLEADLEDLVVIFCKE
jgi:hypothetical protein